jgi:hypothetical protein
MMPTRTLDAEIDRLYQLPLDAFTQARNALAKEADGGAGHVRSLAKPPIAAWAINQLYWKKRDLWDALIAAADNARREHRAVLAGRSGDVRAANKVHEEAVEKALKATLGLLAEAGHPVTDATKQAVATTLRALPGDEPPGRLTRALQPGGFEALAGLAVSPGGPRAHKTAAPSRPAGAPAPEPARIRVDAKALTRARQADASAARALRDAENAARRAEFEQARAEREEKRAAEAVEKARDALRRAQEEVEEAEAAARRATKTREEAIARARDADKALPVARERADAAAADLKAAEKGPRKR